MNSYNGDLTPKRFRIGPSSAAPPRVAALAVGARAVSALSAGRFSVHFLKVGARLGTLELGTITLAARRGAPGGKARGHPYAPKGTLSR